MKKYLLIAVVVAAVAVAVKKVTAGRDDWTNLTEDEARQRLNDRFPDRMPEDKKEIVTDKIVTKMREKGALIDLTETDSVEDAAESTTEATAPTP